MASYTINSGYKAKGRELATRVQEVHGVDDVILSDVNIYYGIVVLSLNPSRLNWDMSGLRHTMLATHSNHLRPSKYEWPCMYNPATHLHEVFQDMQWSVQPQWWNIHDHVFELNNFQPSLTRPQKMIDPACTIQLHTMHAELHAWLDLMSSSP